VLTDHSSITANAFGGNGGNIIIDAGSYLASADSAVTASSRFGVSGTISIGGQETGLNGSLVVLPSELRSGAEIARTSCAEIGGRLPSSLVAEGRGGTLPDPDAPLPSFYRVPLARHRPVRGATEALLPMSPSPRLLAAALTPLSGCR
jgi:large exoprotein involved in heme utilization and adhesion